MYISMTREKPCVYQLVSKPRLPVPAHHQLAVHAAFDFDPYRSLPTKSPILFSLKCEILTCAHSLQTDTDNVEAIYVSSERRIRHIHARHVPSNKLSI